MNKSIFIDHADEIYIPPHSEGVLEGNTYFVNMWAEHTLVVMVTACSCHHHQSKLISSSRRDNRKPVENCLK
jgi:uncharacterized protein YcgI (DUF1989 family)